MDLEHTAARVIASARQRNGGTAAAFDYYVGIHGVEPNGELYQATYIIANEHLPQVQPGDGDDVLNARKANADQLFEQLQSELQRYAERCRGRKYTGWSSASEGPIRYADA